jgi:hypothetical protein
MTPWLWDVDRRLVVAMAEEKTNIVESAHTWANALERVGILDGPRVTLLGEAFPEVAVRRKREISSGESATVYQGGRGERGFV